MATITFCGETFTVDHAVKGADYVHGYDAGGNLIVGLDGVTDFSKITYSGSYLSPGDCLAEACNNVKHCGGVLKKTDGTVITPEMVPGVEYLTTERYNGKAVYTMLVDFGKLPSSGRAYVTAIATGVNVIELVGVATWGNGYEYPFPIISDSTGAMIGGAFIYNGSTTNVGVYANADLSGATAKFKLKYTKQ